MIMQEYRLYEVNELVNVKGGGSGTTIFILCAASSLYVH